ncbi:hypothetical protein [Streptomyces liangshanensis]|uniref:hypothetical protein n=1 Tax=Streptomyces liangshanensis TaxID=2717324 RepID=UPI0036D7E563
MRYTFLHAAARTPFRRLGPGGAQRCRALAHHPTDRPGEDRRAGRRTGETAFRHPVIGPTTLAHEGRRTLIHQAPPGTAEHNALILPAMTAEDVRTP